MAQAVISYDKDLPEIPGRDPWTKPTQHLVKDDDAPTGWQVQEGRRPSQLLLIPKVRQEVDRWRAAGYEGASEVTRRLFHYWFEEDHDISGFDVPFRYYFCQREAIETLAWLVEIAEQDDIKDLIETHGDIYQTDLITKNVEFQTTIDGRRQIRRHIPELDKEGIQDLPPEYLRRYAFKMATGSGKTWVMAMAIVWAYFHRKKVPGSDLSKNFLVVAPNVIVYQRLEKDFASNRVFYELPLIPPEWKSEFTVQVILRGEPTEPHPSGNLFLTNIHQLYESRENEWTPQDALEAILGKSPKRDISKSDQRSMLERVKALSDLVILNDEAHHVHDEDLEWHKSLMAIHRALPEGVSLWLDYSATPKDQNGMYYPWNVVDYPLAQAVEDQIVKAPLIVDKQEGDSQAPADPDNVTGKNAVEKYAYWIQAAVQRWKEHYEVYQQLGVRPVLFIMAERNPHADAIGEYLWKTEQFGFQKSEVLVIHTNSEGEITKKDLEMARQAARDIDRPESTVKVIVSVMMLREGWDVRNVSVVLGLRSFTAKAEILPEQVIGRGLRLMKQVSPDRLQTLEVMGTRNLLKVLRTQLEAEGVGVTSTSTNPPQPVVIYPLRERLNFDIQIPIPEPSLERNYQKLSELSISSLEAIYDREELSREFRLRLRMQFATTETVVHNVDIDTANLPDEREIISSITKKVMDRANLTHQFAKLYPVVREYLTTRCFGEEVDLEDESSRSHLSRLELQEGIAKYLARKIGELTVERRPLEFENPSFYLSETTEFTWRRNLPPLEANKTVFNYVATYNDFERRFARFLDNAEDVSRFAALGSTEQGTSGSQFRVDYLKPNGAIGFYFPDWVVIQDSDDGEVNWIIETKGRIWEGTMAKDEALEAWCKQVTQRTDRVWRYARVNQPDFDQLKPQLLSDLV